MKRPRPQILVLALVPIALASCGAGDKSSNETKKARAMEKTVLARMDLTSDDFRNGQPIPVQYTCDGAGSPPALQWGEAPAGTKSLALIVEDPDAPGGIFRHWGAYDIPSSARSLKAGEALGVQAMNDFGSSGYGAPCPPKGSGLHHYRFRLLALDTERLGLPAGTKVLEVENAARGHAIAEGSLVGTYERN